MPADRRRRILIGLLKGQALIGAGFLLWIFFAGERADKPDDGQRISIDTAAMAIDDINIVRQKNRDLIIIKPSPAVLQQLATLVVPAKTTASEPPLRDYRVSATIKAFIVVRIDDHYLLSGRDHWQRDLVCDEFGLQRDISVGTQRVAIALVCRQGQRTLIYDIAGRSLQADIADLEMPSYEQRRDSLLMAAP